MTGKPSTDTTPVAFGDEADSHVRVISASRKAVLAEWTRRLHLPPVSGLECVQALRGGGFDLAAKLPGCAEMRRGDVVVQVPLAARLEPEVLVALLIRAGVAPARFLDLLDGKQGPRNGADP